MRRALSRQGGSSTGLSVTGAGPDCKSVMSGYRDEEVD
jgi:hypothetical protein